MSENYFTMREINLHLKKIWNMILLKSDVSSVLDRINITVGLHRVVIETITTMNYLGIDNTTEVIN